MMMVMVAMVVRWCNVDGAHGPYQLGSLDARK